MSVLASILALALAARAGAPNAAPPQRPGTIAETPVAPAGSQAAPLEPDEGLSAWRYALATGLAGRVGGMKLSSTRDDPRLLLYFGGQADGAWSERHGQAARLRVRLFTGGEHELYVPSDGDAEALYLLGRPELRFVLARLEVGRYPALGVAALAQAGTLPALEGTVSVASDTMRLSYLAAPVEAAWVRYRGGAHVRHVPGWPAESDGPTAASAGRLRYTVLLPPSVLLSVQGDLVKLWRKADLLVGVEGSLGYEVLGGFAVLDLTARWGGYTRRGLVPDTSTSESELMVLAVVTLAL